MTLEILTLCDFAADYHGRVCISGIIDKIYQPTLPFIIPRLTLYARVRFEEIEDGTYPTRISFIDADGKLVMPPHTGKLHVKFNSEGRTAAANLITHPSNIPINKYGDYRVDFALGEKLYGSVPVFILPPPGKNNLAQQNKTT